MDSHLKELLGNAGFGELDNFELESKDEYDRYFSYIKSAFKAFNLHLEQKLSESENKKVERTIISFFITKLLRSIELLNGKYQFDNSHSIRLDLTESSFPNHAELRQMKADYNLKKEFLAGLPEPLVLKDKLIAKLRTQDDEPLEILDALAKRKYYSSLFPKSIFLMYNKGKLLSKGKSLTGNTSFIYAWGTYDMALNRPQILVLDFEYSDQNSVFDTENLVFKKFEEIIENISEGSQSIFEIAAFVDQELPSIHPKLIKKYDLGPLYGSYSKDENEFTKFHQRHELDNDHFIMIFEEEIVVSVGETEMKSNWLGKNVVLQDFHVNKTDLECQRRKLSEIKKTLIAPHEVIQILLDDKQMEKIILPVRNNMIAI